MSEHIHLSFHGVAGNVFTKMGPSLVVDFTFLESFPATSITERVGLASPIHVRKPPNTRRKTLDFEPEQIPSGNLAGSLTRHQQRQGLAHKSGCGEEPQAEGRGEGWMRLLGEGEGDGNRGPISHSEGGWLYSKWSRNVFVQAPVGKAEFPCVIGIRGSAGCSEPYRSCRLSHSRWRIPKIVRIYQDAPYFPLKHHPNQRQTHCNLAQINHQEEKCRQPSVLAFSTGG